ncbi:MAG: LPS export ABC transporter ATP-binding protein [Nitrospirae bacterium RBG_13_43_8]|nr:MAG: LPS export ABC transporter ATP-binding protein [Nitrospirae bacterium RBG_13_43_8]
MHTLEAKGLSKAYGKRQVLRNLNLYLSAGEIVGLLGPNGAGKTTTFYMMVGVIRPETGNIFLDGEDIAALPMYKRARRGISYLPQEPSIFRKLSVEDNLRAVLEIRGLGSDEIELEVDRLLKEFNLTEFSKRDGYKLSGGERRKAEIARAIAVKPLFILFDEPFTGIDPITIVELKKILNLLKSKGLGILITDHNVRDTLSITDRAYIISNGEILEEGIPDKIVSDPRVKDVFLGEEFVL